MYIYWTKSIVNFFKTAEICTLCGLIEVLEEWFLDSIFWARHLVVEGVLTYEDYFDEMGDLIKDYRSVKDFILNSGYFEVFEEDNVKKVRLRDDGLPF